MKIKEQQIGIGNNMSTVYEEFHWIQLLHLEKLHLMLWKYIVEVKDGGSNGYDGN